MDGVICCTACLCLSHGACILYVRASRIAHCTGGQWIDIGAEDLASVDEVLYF